MSTKAPESLSEAPFLEENVAELPQLIRGELDEATLFRIRDLGGFDELLFDAYRQVCGPKGIFLSSAVGSVVKAADRFARLKVRGDLSSRPVEAPYLRVRRNFDIGGLRENGVMPFTYDIGGRIFARYPSVAGMPSSGKVVDFPLLSYLLPHPTMYSGAMLGTRLLDKGPQDEIQKAGERSWSESAGRWAERHREALRSPLSGGGVGVGRPRK